MPIRPENRHFYAGPEWKALRKSVLERAEDCCEGSPAYPDCRAANRQPHPVTGSTVILTTAHVDQNPANNDMGNLRAWCQRCHNQHDAKARASGIKGRKLAALPWNQQVGKRHDAKSLLRVAFLEDYLSQRQPTEVNFDAALVVCEQFVKEALEAGCKDGDLRLTWYQAQADWQAAQ